MGSAGPLEGSFHRTSARRIRAGPGVSPEAVLPPPAPLPCTCCDAALKDRTVNTERERHQMALLERPSLSRVRVPPTLCSQLHGGDLYFLPVTRLSSCPPCVGRMLAQAAQRKSQSLS